MARAFETGTRIAAVMAGDPNAIQRELDAQITPIEVVVKTFGEVARAYFTNPQKLFQAQLSLWQAHGRLWETFWLRMLGETAAPAIVPDRSDRRFKDPDWDTNYFFDFLKQSYLITTQWAMSLVEDAGLDEHTRLKAR
ncbi:MAG TPA: class I poly(R)-hydroxyalkanoic acid synthase, partial [Sinorhizobium sp.]|nr:class I poly(R)-hydroxyalkanoic acid synthase [Sinorhizobium sp.]